MPGLPSREVKSLYKWNRTAEASLLLPQPPPLFLLIVRIPRLHPPPRRLRIPALANPRTRNPRVPLPQHLLPTHRARRPDLNLPPALTLQRHIARQHVQVPQRRACCEAVLRCCGNGRRQLQEAKVRHVGCAEAHAHKLDLGEQEAVAA